MGAPTAFGDEFLDWLRRKTEGAWASWEPRDFFAEEIGGVDWQRGTRWLGGIDDATIDAAEARLEVRFPADYRLFLRRLHAPDRAMTGAFFGGPAGELVPRERPSFYRVDGTDDDAIRDAHEGVIDGLSFDVEHNQLWLDDWGPRPESEAERAALVRERVAAAPALIPLFGHRLLLGEPCAIGNPVLSVHQSDMIVYGGDLREYLLHELAGVIGPEADTALRASTPRPFDLAAIPFWGDFLS